MRSGTMDREYGIVHEGLHFYYWRRPGSLNDLHERLQHNAWRHLVAAGLRMDQAENRNGALGLCGETKRATALVPLRLVLQDTGTMIAA